MFDFDSFKYPMKDLHSVQFLFEKMTGNVKKLLTETLTTDSFSNILMPVYTVCRAMEKQRTSNIETDTKINTEIGEILRAILKKSKSVDGSHVKDQ